MNKELKEQYICFCCENLKEKEIKSWAKYYQNTIFDVIELSNGKIVSVEKKPLETSFCFGYGYFGTYNEYTEAETARENFLQNEKVFIKKNLESVNSYIKAIEDGEKIYVMRYWLDKTGKCGVLVWGENGNNKGLEELTEEDKKRLLAVFYELKQYTIKKCKTYLKRYGTSKLKTWTYWADE